MSETIEQTIRSRVADFIQGSPHNMLKAHDNIKIYDEPLIGFAAADDVLFREFQSPEIVGPGFTLPEEWLPGAQTVVSYFLPFTGKIRDSNRKEGLPSEEWVSARIDGEAFNNEVRAFLVKLLNEMEAQAAAPGTDPRFKVVSRVSNWSERHVAYAAGLGTFGLHRALITEKGTAGRIGSVITTLKLAPTKRNYDRYDSYCLYLTQGTCGACIGRCPPHAISENGKDHAICSEYIDREILPIWVPRYGCAKCNIRVPCEDKNPTRSQK